MSLRRVGVLLGKELLRGPRNFIFVLALLVPILLSLVMNLLFGTLFSEQAKLGIVDQGSSALTAMAAELDGIALRRFESTQAMRAAVERGSVDLGIVLPADFDRRVTGGEPAQIEAYLWGESALKDRAVLGPAILALVRELAGFEPPVEVVVTTLGEAQLLPWEDRLLPFVVMMAVLVAGLMVPATSLAQERQERTITALLATPTSLADLMAAKGALAVMLSVAMGMLTLMLNRALGGDLLLLLISLSMGAIMAACIGLLLGVYAKDLTTLFATIKSLGLVLYAPALIIMFPEIPQWIARVFPTYYIIQPIIEISQHGADLQIILPQFGIAAIFIAALLVILGFSARRMALQAA